MHVVIQPCHHRSDAVGAERRPDHVLDSREPGARGPETARVPAEHGRPQGQLRLGADSMVRLKQFGERDTAGAQNDYYEVNADAAVGLPTGEPAALQAA